MVTETRSKLAGFCARAWLGIVTGIVWLCILAAGLATVVNGSGETGGDVLIVVAYTTASMVWGGVVVWAYRREPMRKVITEVRDGQKRIMRKLDEEFPADDARAPLAVVHPIRRA